LTNKRIYEFNPNYLSDKQIFEADFDEETKSNKIALNINRTNKEQIKSVDLFEIKENPNEHLKYQKKIQKDQRHHEQYNKLFYIFKLECPQKFLLMIMRTQKRNIIQLP